MITNIHERILKTPLSKVGELIDGLGSPDDLFWPRDRWPAMEFDRPLGVGAVGGHGPIRYFVEDYSPGRNICFRFTAPEGFLGMHWFEAKELPEHTVRLQHVIEMELNGQARFSWPLVFKPLHDALIEDALDRAEAYVNNTPVTLRTWPSTVTLLRRTLIQGGKIANRLTRR